MSRAPSDKLCSQCGTLDFDKLFFSHELLRDWSFTRTFKHIREATDCSFCRLTLAVVSARDDTREFKDASIVVQADKFGCLSHVPPIEDAAPEIKSWKLSEVGPVGEHMMVELKESVMASLRGNDDRSVWEDASDEDTDGDTDQDTDEDSDRENPFVPAPRTPAPRVDPPEEADGSDSGYDEVSPSARPNTPVKGPPVNRLLLSLSRESDRQETCGGEDGAFLTGIQVAMPIGHGVPASTTLLLGRPVDPTVNIRLLHYWIGLCTYSHGSACSPSEMPGAKGFCFRLIDVAARCVVEAPPFCPYAALSYVWGQVRQPVLTDETLEDYSTPGALSNDRETLPLSIRDAMTLCEGLAIPFLWVDSLCINQDSEEDLSRQVGKMNLVYGGATLTIVSAAGEDSDGGLPGLRLDSRETYPDEESIAGLRLIPAQESFTEAMSTAKWETRGWTFQEKMLSQRLLIFTEAQVFYHCNKATWFEDTVLENTDPKLDVVLTEERDIQYFSKPSPDVSTFDRYSMLVEGYTSRDLSRPLDVSEAFRGIESSLSSAFGDKPFLYGLPQAMFEFALRWNAPGHFPDQRLKEYPSWSWQGWSWGAGNAVWFDEMAPVSRRWSADVLWHRPCDDGGFAVLPTNDAAEVEGRDVAVLLQGFWSSVERRPFVHSPERMPPLSHLISASCMVIPLSVDFGGIEANQPEGCKRYGITGPNGFLLGKIDLDAKWREAQRAELDFIEVGKDEPELMEPNAGDCLAYTFLVEWNNGIAFRVQRPVHAFRRHSWTKLYEYGRQMLVTFG